MNPVTIQNENKSVLFHPPWIASFPMFVSVTEGKMNSGLLARVLFLVLPHLIETTNIILYSKKRVSCLLRANVQVV